MSNEVNQAYLRAYIKNRVANSREREVSTPLPTRQIPTSQGGLENLYRRADAAREQIPAPKTVRSAPDVPPAVRVGTPFPAAKPVHGTPAAALPTERGYEIPMNETPVNETVARPVAIRSVLGTRATAANPASPATPSFATMPVVSPRGSVARGAFPGTPAAPAPTAPQRAHYVDQPATQPLATHTTSARHSIAPQPIVRPVSSPAVATPAVTAPEHIPASNKSHLAQPQHAVEPTPAMPDNGGVWSPIGVERGMKGAGVFKQQPAVVVNSTPYAGTVSQAKASDVNPRVPSPEVEHLKNHSPTKIRIDQAHGNATAPAPRVVADEPVARSNDSFPVARERSPEHVAREMARREIEERLVREERKAFVATPLSESNRTATFEGFVEKGATENRQNEFSPSWEVDRFFWPEVLYQLESSDTQAFELIGRHLISANQDGLRVMAVTSGERGVGRSTVAMHLARAAAAAGLKVALLDADTSYPSLIDQLRLDMEHGWQDSLFENVPLEEVAVRSMEDNLTVFPLTTVIAPQQLHANLSRVAKFIKRIADSHDIVFLDSHRLNLEQRDLVGASQENFIDAAVVVVDTELSIKEKVDTAISILQGMGVASIGLVENFHA